MREKRPLHLARAVSEVNRQTQREASRPQSQRVRQLGSSCIRSKRLQSYWILQPSVPVQCQLSTQSWAGLPWPYGLRVSGG